MDWWGGVGGVEWGGEREPVSIDVQSEEVKDILGREALVGAVAGVSPAMGWMGRRCDWICLSTMCGSSW